MKELPNCMNIAFEDKLFSVLKRNNVEEIVLYTKIDFYTEMFQHDFGAISPKSKFPIIYEPVPDLSFVSVEKLLHMVSASRVQDLWGDNHNYIQEFCLTFDVNKEQVIVDRLDA